MKYKKVKTPQDLDEQYKRVLRQAFPKLRFHGMLWNWYKVYKDDPFKNYKFLRIYNAYKNAVKVFQ